MWLGFLVKLRVEILLHGVAFEARDTRNELLLLVLKLGDLVLLAVVQVTKLVDFEEQGTILLSQLYFLPLLSTQKRLCRHYLTIFVSLLAKEGLS